MNSKTKLVNYDFLNESAEVFQFNLKKELMSLKECGFRFNPLEKGKQKCYASFSREELRRLAKKIVTDGNCYEMKKDNFEATVERILDALQDFVFEDNSFIEVESDSKYMKIDTSNNKNIEELSKTIKSIIEIHHWQ